VDGKKHTFAPRDVRLLVYRAKENKEGLGYEKGRGMGRLPEKQGVCEYWPFLLSNCVLID
jgi:hypothetical protein